MTPSQPTPDQRRRDTITFTVLLAAILVLTGAWLYLDWLALSMAALGLIAVITYVSHLGNPVIGLLLRIDLVRTSRRTLTFLFRAGYAFALLVVLYLLYVQWFGRNAGLPWDVTAQPHIRLKEMAQFAESFFWSFMLAQLAAVVLFTPAYVAGVIAEEKDRRTLDFLFISDLTDREIIFSKVASRLLHLGLLLLTGVPVLMMATFFGGISPELVLLGFLSNTLTMLTLAGTSLLCSVYADRTLTALLSAYLVAAAQLFCCGLCGLPFYGPRVGGYFWLDVSIGGGGFGVLFQLVFQGWVTATCFRWAALRLRAWYRIRASGPAKAVVQEEGLAALRKGRPPVGDDPLLWKERYCTPAFGLSASARAAWADYGPPITILGALLLFLFVGAYHFSYGILGGPSGAGRSARNALTGVGTAILYLMILAAAIRAACSLGHERDRNTLESLLTLPWDDRDFLAAKWQAAFWSVRRGWWLVALVWLPGVPCGLHWLTGPLLVLAGGTYLAFAVSLGLWFSLVCQTTLRAILWTLAVLFAVSVFPFWQGILSPTATLASLAFWSDAAAVRALVEGYQLAVLVPALGVYAMLAWVMWTLTNMRFGPVTGRMAGDPAARPPAAPRPGEDAGG